jgi:DNA-binding transcriptional MocR family regulator
MQKVSSAISPIITIDGKVVRSLRRQLYDGYRAAAVGVMLRPSARRLASEVGISRLPFSNAYAPLLTEGHFQSHVGTGTAGIKHRVHTTRRTLGSLAKTLAP